MAAEMKSILDNVIEKISVPIAEKLLMDRELLSFEKNIKPQLKKHQANLFIGGSLAKQTLIKRDHAYDIDIFVLFPYKLKDKSLSDILEASLKKSKIHFIKLHGSRDYFQVRFKNLVLELIPILEIKNASQALNITDISPLHVSYILQKIKKNKKINDEIKLAKAFCYAADCYGAESYIRGFSGYSLEVLVSHYGSFINFIKQAARWNTKDKIIIDPKKYYKDKKKILQEINISKQISPLILIDPVQKERNVSAALSHETLNKFIIISKQFLSHPSEKFFFKEHIDINKLRNEAKKSKSNLIIIKVKSSKAKIDVAGAKLKKFYEFLEFLMKKNDFKMLKGIFDLNEKTLDATFYFILKEPDKEYIVQGPPLSVDKKYQDAFKKKWPKAFVKNKRLFAKAKRDVVDFKHLIDSIQKSQIKEMGINSIIYK